MSEKTEAEIEAERKEEAIEWAERVGAKIDKRWNAEKIESAALAAEIAAEEAEKAAAAAAQPPAAPPAPAPATENADDRAAVMKQAHELGMDLEDLKGRPLEDVISMVGKMSAETALERQSQRKQILEEAAKVGLNVNDQEFLKLSDEAILEQIGAAQTARVRALQSNGGRAVEPGKVRGRVTLKGDGKISKGIHVPGVGDLTYKRNDIVPNLNRRSALELQDRGLIEIEE